METSSTRIDKKQSWADVTGRLFRFSAKPFLAMGGAGMTQVSPVPTLSFHVGEIADPPELIGLATAAPFANRFVRDSIG